jgi:iron complex transport system substrate-binding protein
MRKLATLLAACIPLQLVMHAVTATAAEPRRVMSLSMCTDDLLLELLPPERIASLTYYVRQRSNAELWPQAATVPINYGTTEEILAAKPDLVLAGTYTTPATRRILKNLHFALLEVPPASNFDEIRAMTRDVASALGRQQAAEVLIAQMDTTLRELASSLPSSKIRVAAWGEAGAVPGKGTLFDAILTAAGGVNIAADDRGPYTSFDIEQLLLARPDVIAYSSSTTDTPGLNTDLALHPLILKLYAGRRITYPSALSSCGLVESANAAVALRASLQKVMATRP